MSCGSTGGFPSASSMEQQSTNQTVIWEEINDIQQAILAAASQCQPGGGKTCVTVGGNTPMTFISGVTSVTVNSGGAGYVADSPGVQFVPPLGVTPSILATGTVTTNGSSILSVNITNPGLGYEPVPATLSVTSLAGTGAVLIPVVNAQGGIVAVNISNPGTGYLVTDSVIATRAVAFLAGYVNAIITITAVSNTGAILSVAITNPGSGYQPSVTTVNIVSTLNPLMPYPIGGAFYASVTTTTSGAISNVLISNTGSGYAKIQPYLVITDPGTGATTAVTLVGSAVGSIAVLTPGDNYDQFATGTVLNPPTASAPNPPASPAVVTINVANNTYGTNPLLYYQVWTNTITNTSIQNQLNAVLAYFTGLGYSIQIQSNPATGYTIQWHISW